MTFKFFKNSKCNRNAFGIKKSLPWSFAFARATGMESLLSLSKSRLFLLSPLCNGRSPATRRLISSLSSLGERLSSLSSLGERSETRGSIRHHIRLMTAIYMILTLSTTALADDTTATETCANGAGTVITGAVSGHKYCKSNNAMNWWNANAWCDGMGRRLFDVNSDCHYSITSMACLELAFGNEDPWFWTMNPYGLEKMYDVHGKYGAVHNDNKRSDTRTALCY